MTSRFLLTLVTVATALFLAAPAEAGGKKAGKGAANGGRFLSRFDRNQDGKLDGQEAVRLQAIYTSLYALDTDHNGQLSDAEIAAAKIPAGGAKKGGGKKQPQPQPSSTSGSQSQPNSPAK
jgi:hypothetical protein